MFNVIREQCKFITSVYQKPTFSGVYIHFDSFLPDIYKIGMIYTLVNRCLRICCSWSIFHHELILLREIFLGLKLQKSIEGVLNCCKLFLKVKINSVIIFALKALFSKLLHQVWFITFSMD